MKQDKELLNQIYQNTKMGEESINILLKAVKAPDLRDDLIAQMQGYAGLNVKAKKQLYEAGENPVEEPFFTKLIAGGMVRMNAAKADSVQKIAEMMIEGSTMGIVDAREALNHCPGASKPVRKLADEVISFEQDNIGQMKRFL